MIPVPRYLLPFDTRSVESETCDVLVIGSGISGLFVALKLAERFQVALVCKQKIGEGSSKYAQGGVAVALEGGKSEALHVKDTLRTGLGLSDERKVRSFVQEGKFRIFDLERYGVNFDREHGDFHRAREAAHSEARILHVRGDATGEGIEHALAKKARRCPDIFLNARCYGVELFVDREGCRGALFYDEQKRKYRAFFSRACVLATGGAGQVYRYTTNPHTATGDGVSMAYRAGAEISDMEFFQFHPTAYYTRSGRNFLMTEALRGEGALIRNHKGERFLKKIHPLAELAPRDVVSVALYEEMKRTQNAYMYLDVTKIPARHFMKRFPRIYKWCRGKGLDISREWIPIAPSAHYMIGGVRTDDFSETSIKNLYAVGEVACTSIHGANRLASNSLLECLVFSHRAAARIKKTLDGAPGSRLFKKEFSNKKKNRAARSSVEFTVKDLKNIMWQGAGILRDEEGLLRAGQSLQKAFSAFHVFPRDVPSMELYNMMVVSSLILEGAFLRRETRGCHVRREFTRRNDKKYKKHFVFRRQYDSR